MIVTVNAKHLRLLDNDFSGASKDTFRGEEVRAAVLKLDIKMKEVTGRWQGRQWWEGVVCRKKRMLLFVPAA
jgi:hypothetical protein